MAEGVLMPKAGITVESCIISEWKKKVGDHIEVGDILFSYETDKAMFECESTAAGELLDIFFEDGDEVPCLVNVCAIGNKGEDTSSLRPEGSAPAAAEEPAGEAAPAAEEKKETAPVVSTASAGQKVFVSPRARNLASRSGVDASLATPTGAHGRIVENDVRRLMEEGVPAPAAKAVAAQAAAPALTEADYEDVKFSGIRRSIAKAMHNSLASMAQLTNHFSFDATQIKSYRKMLKGLEGDISKISLGDMMMFAVSRTLPDFPDMNANMLDDSTIRHFRHVNLGFACDTPRGLMVPTVFNADTKSLLEISLEIKSLAAQAREGSINPDLLQGGTFTVSNLGSLNVEMFTPVINPPQTGILGVCNIQTRVREGADGSIKTYPAMGLSLSYDHRAVDGAPASRFMTELCANLENFTALLAK